MNELNCAPVNFGASTIANSNATYHADKDILSSTMLKHALLSPDHFVHEYTNYRPPATSLMFGSLMHALVMEPLTINELVAISPTPLDRSASSREFKKQNPGRFCMWMGDYVKAQQLALRTLDERFRGRPFYKFVEDSECEQSIYYTDPVTGLRCRTRPDMKHDEFIFDIKTTRHCGPREFAFDAERLHYDLSAFMYLLSDLLLRAQVCGSLHEIQQKPSKRFVVISITNTEPHGIFFRPASDNFITNGQKKYNSAMKTIAACMKADYWPSTSGELELDIEHWQQFDAKRAPWLVGLNATALEAA